ncbi:tetraacyldisaccharide 4'-kinase [Acidobacteriota bacterium]
MNGLLAFLSLIYQVGCQLKNLFYRIHLLRPKKASLPVISIGNITFGGSEKTPLAMVVIAMLLNKGHKPALVTRGYKGKWEKKGGILSDGKDILGNWTDSGDEAYMVAKNFPQAGVFVGKDRLRSCQEASQLGFDVAVLDDGFQHRKLFRDCDIVLHNPEKRIPRREPVSSLTRAHALLLKEDSTRTVTLKGSDHFPGVTTYIYSVDCLGFFPLDGGIQADTEVVKNKKVLAFCGIARPERFLTLLTAAGIRPCTFLKFADHHAYPHSTQKKLLNAFQEQQADVFLTTEKDAVKIKDLEMFEDRPVYYLKIGLNIEDAFGVKVLSLLGKTGSNQIKDAI